MKGVEARRRETLEFSAKAQIKLFEMLLLEDKSLPEVIEFVNGLKEYVQSSMTKEEVTLQIKLSKDVSLYDKQKKDDFGNVVKVIESKLAHVKVAKWLREQSIKENGMNTWEKGCYVKYIVTKGYGGIEATSIYNYENNYDAVYYWNVKVFALLQRILLVVYPFFDWEQFLIEVTKASRKKIKKSDLDTSIFDALGMPAEQREELLLGKEDKDFALMKTRIAHSKQKRYKMNWTFPRVNKNFTLEQQLKKIESEIKELRENTSEANADEEAVDIYHAAETLLRNHFAGREQVLDQVVTQAIAKNTARGKYV
jgi:hypothetical protein